MPNIKKLKNKKNNKPIGVFDSGVGGLSILKELQSLLPNENFVFLADQLYVPYGEKSKEELVNLVHRVADYFVKNHDIKMLVVACNTATCNAIRELRETHKFPIVGTVPAIKTAAEKTKSGTVAVIATPSTSKSQTLQDLINAHCSDINVINIGCKNLEDEVETGELESSEVTKLLEEYLKKVKNSQTDHLVLGCTHYPFLKKQIEKILGPQINLIDSGKPIARRALSLLDTHLLKNSGKDAGQTLHYTTGDFRKFSRVASALLGKQISSEKVRI